MPAGCEVTASPGRAPRLRPDVRNRGRTSRGRPAVAASLRGHFSWVRRQRRVTVPKVDGAGELPMIRVYSIHTKFYALAKNSFVPRLIIETACLVDRALDGKIRQAERNDSPKFSNLLCTLDRLREYSSNDCRQIYR